MDLVTGEVSKLASNESKTTFGATIVPSQSRRADDEISLPAPIRDSPALTPSVSHEDLNPEYSERRIPPHSPFYQHPCDSTERTHSRSTSKVNVGLNEKDLEAGIRTPLTPADPNHPFNPKVSVECNQECKMWPSKQTLVQSRKEDARRKREGKMCGGCAPVVEFWDRFTKRQKLYIKIAIWFLVIGAVVAIAVGITAAVNGSVYVSEDKNEQIPNPRR